MVGARKDAPALIRDMRIVLYLVIVILALAGVMTCRGAEKAVIVAWNPNPEPGVTYRIWRGIELLGETTETRLEVRLPTDQISTITATAHRGELSSLHSKRLVVAPAVVHSSPDMRVWIVEKSSVFFQTLEREGQKTEKQFFRVNYHTP